MITLLLTHLCPWALFSPCTMKKLSPKRRQSVILLLHLVVLVKQFTLRGYTTTPLPRTGQSTKIVFLMQYAHSINTEFSHKFIIICSSQMSLTCQWEMRVGELLRCHVSVPNRESHMESFGCRRNLALQDLAFTIIHGDINTCPHNWVTCGMLLTQKLIITWTIWRTKLWCRNLSSHEM